MEGLSQGPASFEAGMLLLLPEAMPLQAVRLWGIGWPRWTRRRCRQWGCFVCFRPSQKGGNLAQLSCAQLR